MMFKDDKYFLFYSSSWVTMTSYKVGVAVADSVLGEFVKSNEPVIQTRGGRQDQCGWLCTIWGSDSGPGSGDQVMFEGPGHGSVVEDGAGDWWLVYAVWRAGLVNTWPPGRLMMLDRITWSGATQIMSTGVMCFIKGERTGTTHGLTSAIPPRRVKTAHSQIQVLASITKH